VTRMADLYWQSETHKRSISADELRSVLCCIVSSVGHFVWQAQSAVPRARSRIVFGTLMLCTGILQYVWYWFAPSSFLKCRTRIRIFNRCAAMHRNCSALQTIVHHCCITGRPCLRCTASRPWWRMVQARAVIRLPVDAMERPQWPQDRGHAPIRPEASF
jgi:hypothetical protein